MNTVTVTTVTTMTTIEADGCGYLYEDECPDCGGPIKRVRQDHGVTHNAECRKCVVIWSARPTFVRFDVTSRPTVFSEFGAMVFK